MIYFDRNNRMEEHHDPVMHANGFEGAVIGVAKRCGETPVVIYSHHKCIEILEGQGMTEEEAMEHIEYNLIGAWVGPGTPMIVHEMSFAEVEEYSEGWVE